MAGQMAEERHAGPTADGFIPHASQVRNATVDYVMPREVIGSNRPRTRIVPTEPDREEDEYIIDQMMKTVPVREADRYFTERLVKPKDNFQRLPSDQTASDMPSLKGSSGSSSDSSLKGTSIQSLKASSGSSSDSEGPAAGGGGPPRVFKTPPKVLEKARQQAQERKAKLDSIREKVEGMKPITTEERQFVMKSRGAKRLQRTLYLMDIGNKYQSSDDQRSAKEKIKKGKKIVAENI